jgi:hypothetical protein
MIYGHLSTISYQGYRMNSRELSGMRGGKKKKR